MSMPCKNSPVAVIAAAGKEVPVAVLAAAAEEVSVAVTAAAAKEVPVIVLAAAAEEVPVAVQPEPPCDLAAVQSHQPSQTALQQSCSQPRPAESAE